MPQSEKSFSGMTVLIVFLSFFSFSATGAEAQQTGTRPLARLLQIAMENSPEILNAKRNLQTAQLERGNTTAALLPSIDLETSQGISDQDPRPEGQTNPWSSTLKLGLTETLYDNGDSIAKRRIALRKESRAGLEYNRALNDALKEIAEAYFTWSQAMQSLKIQEEQRETVDRQYKMIRGGYRQGVKTRRDVLRMETQVRRTQLQRVQADNSIKVAELELARKVGVPVTSLIKEGIAPAKAPTNFVPPPLPAPLELESHPVSKILALQVEEAQIEADRIGRQYWPELSLNSGIAYNTSGYMGTGVRPNDNDFVDWQALVTLKYNLFDFGTRRRTAEMARLDAARTKDTNRGSKLELDNTLRSQYISLKESRENIQATKELLDLELKNFAAQEADYRSGQGRFLDLSEALGTLVDAKNQYNQTFFEFKRQQVNYAFQQGRVEEFFMAQ